MNFDISDEQRMLAETARRLFAEMSSPSRLRALADEGAAMDRPLWAALADMGFTGAAIASADGGLGRWSSRLIDALPARSPVRAAA